MKDIIILEKVKKKTLSKDSADIIVLGKLTWVLSFINFIWRYKWKISNVDINTIKRLGLTKVKKYLKYTDQVEMELDYLYD